MMGYVPDYIDKLKTTLFSMDLGDQEVEEEAPSLTSYQQFPDREDLLVERVSRYCQPRDD